MLTPLLIERMTETGAREHPVLLEVMTRRWYRTRELTEFASAITSDGTAYVTTSYKQNGRRYNLAAALVDVNDLDNVAGAISRRAARYPQEDAIHIDLYAGVTADDELAARLKQALEDADVPPLVERIVLDVPAPERGVSAADAITLRRGIDGELGARPRPAVRAPGAGRAAEPVAHVGVRARAHPVAGRRLPVPRRRPLEPQGRAAVRARRGARAERRAQRATAASSRCPSSSMRWPRRSSRCGASRPAARRASGCCGTACA